MRIKNHFNQLVLNKQAEIGRKISDTEIAQETGVARSTVASWRKGRARRFDEDVIVAFCDYLGCTLAELLEYAPDGME